MKTVKTPSLRKDSGQRRAQNRRKFPWTRVKDTVDLVAKLAASAAIVLAAYVAHNFQSAANVSTLLQQREQSDTTIRAEMFKAITERLFGAKGGSLPPDQKAVFSELLALNFHEHIEVKPLMLEIDSALAASMRSEKLGLKQRSAFKARREELWSVARRVRARQIAMLVAGAVDADASSSGGLLESARTATASFVGWIGLAQAASATRPHLERAHVEFLGVRFPANRRLPVQAGGTGCDVRAAEGQNGFAGEPMWVASPGGGSPIALIVEKAEWNAERFNLRVKLDSGRNTAPPVEGQLIADRGEAAKSGKQQLSPAITGQAAVLFETTWFDFPLTDNTLLASGDRFAVFIDEVCKPTADPGLGAVRLGVLWFPQDYFPPRERPTNYHQSREVLGLGNRA